MKILTGPFSQSHWNSTVEQFEDLSLLQTWEYGEASSRTRALRVTRVLFESEGGIVGAAQGFMRRLPVVAGGAVVINRAPLWRRDKADTPTLTAVLAALCNHYVRDGMYLRVSPAIVSGGVSEDVFHQAGFHAARCARPWVSARMDLFRPVEILREGLRKNWAASLKKAEAAGITVEFGSEEILLKRILQELEALLRAKQFQSTVTPDFLERFQQVADDHHKLWIFAAMHNGRSLGGIALARYGSVCEYLVGAVNDEGKRLNAGQLLLWSAILAAKDEGYQWLDLGGTDPNATPEGVLYFKSGLNAPTYAYIGEFEAYSPTVMNRLIRWRLERELRTSVPASNIS